MPCSSLARRAAALARSERAGALGARTPRSMRAISRARPVAPSSDSSSRLEKRLSRCSMSSVRASSVVDQRLDARRGARRACRRCGGCSCRSARPPRRARGRARRTGRRAAPRSPSALLVMAWNELMCWSTWLLVTPLRSATSFMVATNSETRVTSVFSIALMFSCAPLSTSCSRMLASRSRSNSVVVSERSMLCVSSISETLAEAVCLRLLDRGLGAVLQLLERAVDGGGRGLARLVDEAGDLLAVVHHGPREGEALGFDRLHGVVGGLDRPRSLNSLLLPLSAVSSVLELASRMRVISAARCADLLADLVGLADEVARHLGADAEQRALDVAGVLLEHVADAGRHRGQRALDLAGVLLDVHVGRAV